MMFPLVLHWGHCPMEVCGEVKKDAVGQSQDVLKRRVLVGAMGSASRAAQAAKQDLCDARLLHPAHVGGGGGSPGLEGLRCPAKPFREGSLPPGPVGADRIGHRGKMADNPG